MKKRQTSSPEPVAFDVNLWIKSAVLSALPEYVLRRKTLDDGK
jgi:hypothetical protein